MGWNYRKRIRIAPGVKLNISKSGVSTTIGGKGASINVGKNGAYLNTSIPGTGWYNRQKISTGKKSYRFSGVLGTQDDSHDSFFKIRNTWGCVFRWLGILAFIYLMIALFKIITGSFEFTEDNVIILSFISVYVIVWIIKMIFFMRKVLNPLKFLDKVEFKITDNVPDNPTTQIMKSHDDNKTEVIDNSKMTDDVKLENPMKGRETEASIEKEVSSGDDRAANKCTVTPALEDLEPYDPKRDLENYHYPTLDLLKKYENGGKPYIDTEEQTSNKNRIVEVLGNFGIMITTIKATVGPSITLYEMSLASGVRISKIKNQEDDISLSLAPFGIRIIAPIPGKDTIGVEMPNAKPVIVSMESILNSKKFQETTMDLPCALGKTITNEVFMFDLAKAPHLLVAGATGQGKSVGLHAIITSLIYKKHPAEMKLVLMDPRGGEFNTYRQIANHYLAALPEEIDTPIVTDCNVAIKTLQSLCKEMDKRFELLDLAQVKNIREYNRKFINRQLNPNKGHKYLPYIVIVIDEYGALMYASRNDVELPIVRIVKLASAVGIHLIVSTAMPTKDILSSDIITNIPSRLAFRVSSRYDSQFILNSNGAEQLMSKGDMLFQNGAELMRVQCAFVDKPEVECINDFVATQQSFRMPFELPEPDAPKEDLGDSADKDVDMQYLDPLFEDAARLIVINQSGSTSLIQRKFAIGYNRAGRLMDQLEKVGVVGAAHGCKPREVLVKKENALEDLLLAVRKAPQKYYSIKEKKCPKILHLMTYVDLSSVATKLKELATIISHDSQLAVAMRQTGKTEKNSICLLIMLDIVKGAKELGYSITLNSLEGQSISVADTVLSDIPMSYNLFKEQLASSTESAKKLHYQLQSRLDTFAKTTICANGYNMVYLLRSDIELQKIYLTLMYRFMSLLIKADNVLSQKEIIWLDLLIAERDKMQTNQSKDVNKYQEQDKQNTKNHNDSDPITELQTLIGLSEVKTEVSGLASFVKIQQEREKQGMKAVGLSYHCVFTGNPGTGKTTVARILAAIYRDLGILKKGHLVETDRSGLVAEYVGQTAVKTNKIIDSALDGVLFIDEAYSLVQGGGNDYGQEAISTLLKRMEDDRDRLIVVLAGYSEDMKRFIDSNPGLQSRFNRYIHFADYTVEELNQIFLLNVDKNQYQLDGEGKELLNKILTFAVDHKDKNFGNGRYVRNLFEKTIQNQAMRLSSLPNITATELSMLKAEDLPTNK